MALAPLLGFLRDRGLVPPPRRRSWLGGRARILAEFEEYLLQVRGLSEATVGSYCSQVRPLVCRSARWIGYR